MIGLSLAGMRRVLLLGAHCDDIAIGAGGLVATLASAPGTRFAAFVGSGAGTPREAEERKALAALAGPAPIDVTVLDLPDGRAPAHWQRYKSELEALRVRLRGEGFEPDLIVAPHAADAHQDHRTLATLVSTVFRDHTTLGYEILKWESDLAQPSVYLPLSDADLAAKWALLADCYPSQHGRTWFDEETFRGLARVRGVQCNRRYAEAFHTAKLVLAP